MNLENLENGDQKRRRRRGAKARTLKIDNESHSMIKKSSSSSTTTTPQNNGRHSTSDNVKKDMSSNKNSKKKKKGKAPKPGDEGFLTPTQMRNARKRRAKQRKQEQNEEVHLNVQAEGAAENEPKSKRRKKSNRNLKNNNDPSMRYIQNPESAPLVQNAIQYFKSKGPFQCYMDKNKTTSFQTNVGALDGWRTVSKLPVRRTPTGKTTIGLFKEKSHSVVSVPDCAAHHPSINSTIQILQDTCDELEIQPYDESSGDGFLRYVCINVERCSGCVQLTLVWNSKPYDFDKSNQNKDIGEKKLQKLTDKIISLDKARHSVNDDDDNAANELKLHSLWVHYNAQWKHADNIFDFGSTSSSGSDDKPLWKHIHGPKSIIEKLDLSNSLEPCPKRGKEAPLHFPPTVFRQANISAFTNIVVAIRNYLIQYNHQRTKGKKTNSSLPSCLELYGGVGTIGLNICDVLSKLISSDENPHNEACFEKSVSLYNCEDKCSYIPKNATKMVQEEKEMMKQDILVVDPPRKGLGDVVLQSIIDSADIEGGPEVFVYVSCGFDAFKRECDCLLRSKKWKLDYAEGWLLFPGSNAIETLAFFKKI